MTFRAEHIFVLPVPPEAAFGVLSDPAMDPDWQTACVRSELLDGPAHQGGRYEITFQLVGKTMDFMVEITDYDPGRRSSFRVLQGPFTYVGTYTYTDRGDGSTSVHWTFDVEPGDYFGVMPLALVKKLLISQVNKDSSRLARTLEAQGAPRA